MAHGGDVNPVFFSHLQDILAFFSLNFLTIDFKVIMLFSSFMVIGFAMASNLQPS
jgi:predicted RND superfamily exporter protein